MPEASKTIGELKADSAGELFEAADGVVICSDCVGFPVVEETAAPEVGALIVVPADVEVAVETLNAAQTANRLGASANNAAEQVNRVVLFLFIVLVGIAIMFAVN